MGDHAKLIADLGGTVATAKKLGHGVTPNMTWNWRAADRVPWRWRPALAVVAKREKITLPEGFLEP